MSAVVLGDPHNARTLVIVDHASAELPDGVDLGLPADQMERHIAYDIGTFEIAELLAATGGFAAICAPWTRLLVDTNRCVSDPAAIPVTSDGHVIPANDLDEAARDERFAAYHRPYHDTVSDWIDRARPDFLIFLHSFTPALSAVDSEARPWEVGLLYNRDRRGADIAMDFFAHRGFCVGDQEPYSGLIYNYSFVRHAERRGLPHILLEIRQDEIEGTEGQARFAGLIRGLNEEILEKLA